MVNAQEVRSVQRELMNQLLYAAQVSDYLLWYYTPMARPFTHHLVPRAIVYDDCMDELSAFQGAPTALRDREAELMRCADLVLTGGQSLQEAKQHQHRNIHAFPSSVDAAHFARARRISDDPPDQAPIPHPRLGFLGVIDERMDLGLVDGVAAARPNWQIVRPPLAKSDAGSLPQRPSIHYLGVKSYDELSRYIAGPMGDASRDTPPLMALMAAHQKLLEQRYTLDPVPQGLVSQKGGRLLGMVLLSAALYRQPGRIQRNLPTSPSNSTPASSPQWGHARGSSRVTHGGDAVLPPSPGLGIFQV